MWRRSFAHQDALADVHLRFPGAMARMEANEEPEQVAMTMIYYDMIMQSLDVFTVMQLRSQAVSHD